MCRSVQYGMIVQNDRRLMMALQGMSEPRCAAATEDIPACNHTFPPGVAEPSELPDCSIRHDSSIPELFPWSTKPAVTEATRPTTVTRPATIVSGNSLYGGSSGSQ